MVNPSYIMDHVNTGLNATALPLGTTLIWVGNDKFIDSFITKIGPDSWFNVELIGEDGGAESETDILTNEGFQAMIDDLFNVE